MGRGGARAAALTALIAVEEGLFLEPALERGDRVAGPDGRERGLARRIVRGVLQNRGRIDWILGRFLDRSGPERLDPRTRNLLRAGLFQLLFLSAVPARAAVFETVALARRSGGEPAARLVNGVLRRFLREGEPPGIPSIEDDPAGHLSIRESHPLWLASRWVARLGVERAALRMAAGNRIPPLSLRVLDGKKVDAIAGELEAEGAIVLKSALHPAVLMLREGGDPSRLAPFRRGEMIVQDEGIAAAGRAAEPVDPAARVADLCAAPGGKILPIAVALGPEGRSAALDLSERRLRRLEENRRRVAADRLLIAAADALAPPLRRARFDLVLLDVPCSGLGVLARRPDLRWRVREEDPARLARLQIRMIRSAAELVEPGGLLVYSTCTTEAEENEETVGRFLGENRRFRLEAPPADLPESCVAPDGTVRILPETHRCDGAFAARLRRIDR
ncbi:MAG: 16S rRNA (cytosine(967)-C(5))-methyltransferase RsmB [Candidatus Eisenbacteria bacterium]|nr:16S rRNA (cytosine(967)-C(5))-methyltransferase RsmB [Candidatus Eisenbacteria bacterium]